MAVAASVCEKEEQGNKEVQQQQPAAISTCTKHAKPSPMKQQQQHTVSGIFIIIRANIINGRVN